MRPIEEIAREAGVTPVTTHTHDDNGPRDPMRLWIMGAEAMARFAAIVRAEALEEAAAVCASVGAYYAEGDAWEVACIANIRAMKDAPHA